MGQLYHSMLLPEVLAVSLMAFRFRTFLPLYISEEKPNFINLALTNVKQIHSVTDWLYHVYNYNINVWSRMFLLVIIQRKSVCMKIKQVINNFPVKNAKKTIWNKTI